MGVGFIMSSAAPTILPGNSDHDKLLALSKLTYKQQAVWFLNAFWETVNADAEKLWKYVITCSELDLQDHEDGCGLDEVNAHRFLEVYGETLTVRELRSKLRSTGALEESERPKVVPLTHYLLFRYNVDWHALVNASQGDNSKEIAKAQAMLDQVQAAFRDADAKHKQAAASFREAERTAAEAASREADAKAKEAEAVQKEAPFKAAQEELEAALGEVKRQEDEYQGKIADCESRAEQGGVVSRNKAKAELAVLKAEDPLPLQRAKITLEAATKRAEKTRAPFEAATNEAKAARAEAVSAREAADQAKAESESDKIAAEAALNEAKQKVKEAEDYLEELKSRPGCAHGALWWIDRELFEAKKYIPTSKGGISK